jgi:hypothetical protein
MGTSSPWARAGSPSVTLPPPPGPPPPAPTGTVPPAAVPFPSGLPQAPISRRRLWPWAIVGLLLAIVVSAATGSLVTFAAMRNGTGSSAQASAASPTSTQAAPQYSSNDAAAAKAHLCQVFDVSVRGQQGKGGMRVEGNLNVPLVLRSVNSALAVQTALVPATPAEVASAARNYVQATLDLTTAAMGNTSTAEGNRLNDISNDAINALLDACGLPR